MIFITMHKSFDCTETQNRFQQKGFISTKYHFSTSEYDALKHLVIWRMTKVLESSSAQKMRHDKTIMFQKLEIRSSVLSTPF